MLLNPVKDKLGRGDAVFGTVIALPSPEVAEIVGLAGYDWALLDTEHGPLGSETLQAMVRACRVAGMTPFARVRELQPKMILQVLDVGCLGVMVPQIETPEQAAAAVAATKYPPEGVRSLAAGAAASAWGTVSLADHVARSNAAILNILQIESRAGLDAADAIAAVPGVDALFIGPSDLSASLGHLGQPGHPAVQAAIRRIFEAGLRAGVVVGIQALTAEDVRTYRALGATLFVDSTTRLLLQAARAQVASLRDAAASSQRRTG